MLWMNRLQGDREGPGSQSGQSLTLLTSVSVDIGTKLNSSEKMRVPGHFSPLSLVSIQLNLMQGNARERESKAKEPKGASC